MSQRTSKNVAASIRAKLFSLAQRQGEDFNLTLIRYANERFLYRLSLSTHRNNFILKGGMLLPVLGGESYRPSRDIDLLGHGDVDAEGLGRIMREVAAIAYDSDAMKYQGEQLTTERIQATHDYGGVRVRVPATLGNILLSVQLDIAFGDVVTPPPHTASYPTLLPLPAPVLRMYPLETVIAEKFEALVRFGLINSRIKDYYDLWTLAQTQRVDGRVLVEALRGTFNRRGTTLPIELPAGLGPQFYGDRVKQRQWQNLAERVSGAQSTTDFPAIATVLAAFLMPPSIAASRGEALTSFWHPGEGWRKP